MTIQHALVVVLFVAAVAYLAYGAWQTWRGSCSGCGCSKTKKPEGGGLIPVDELLSRVRRGSS